MTSHMKNYEDITDFGLDEADEVELIAEQNECTFVWVTMDGSPMAVTMSYLRDGDGTFWLTASSQRLIAPSLIHELCSGHDLNPGRRNEVKLLIWYLDVLPLLMKAKFGLRAVEFLNHDADDEAVRRYLHQCLLYPITHAFRNSPEDNVPRIHRLLI